MEHVSTKRLLLFLAIALPISGRANVLADSTRQKQREIATKLTVRTHSAGFFYFGGKVAEYNPAADLSFNMESRNFGFTVFKAADLSDLHSSFNFALAGIYKNILLHKRLRVTPQFLVLIEQPNRIVDEGSDVGCTLTTAWKISNTLSLDETFIVFNVVFETEHMDMINRMRLTYTKKHFDIIGMAWHNNGIIDREKHLTSALSVGYNRVNVSSSLTLGATLMAASTWVSSNKEEVPERKGVVLTLTAIID
jgi:hypothetical protein